MLEQPEMTQNLNLKQICQEQHRQAMPGIESMVAGSSKTDKKAPNMPEPDAPAGYYIRHFNWLQLFPESAATTWQSTHVIRTSFLHVLCSS